MEGRGCALGAIGIVALLAGPLAAEVATGKPVTYEDIREGDRIFKARCGSCHEFTLPLGEEKAPAFWVHIIDKMSGHGLTLSSEEKGKILSFLTAKSAFDKMCAQCHDKSRCLSRSKSYADWLRTVKRMSLLVRDGIEKDLVDAITIYLAVVCPRKGA